MQVTPPVSSNVANASGLERRSAPVKPDKPQKLRARRSASVAWTQPAQKSGIGEQSRVGTPAPSIRSAKSAPLLPTSRVLASHAPTGNASGTDAASAKAANVNAHLPPPVALALRLFEAARPTLQSAWRATAPARAWVANVFAPATAAVAPRLTSAWETTKENAAPRIERAHQLWKRHPEVRAAVYGVASAGLIAAAGVGIALTFGGVLVIPTFVLGAGLGLGFASGRAALRAHRDGNKPTLPL